MSGPTGQGKCHPDLCKGQRWGNREGVRGDLGVVRLFRGLGDSVLSATLETVAVAVHLQDVDARWVRRSSNAPVSLSDPKTSVHSSKGRLVVTRIEPRS